MAISAGTRIGPYEVLSPLGEGGMGQVWRARDGRLGREIAIKVLPESIAADPGFLSRFQAEARAASALNHPNIITIHDIGTAGETPYILMELVEGQTLRKLLEAGPLPLKKTLAIASQVADGLAVAHARGIVHRDLKPDNVMVTREGVAKILDFGLARPLPAESSDEKTESAYHVTEPGTILGTVGYMSPEQATGRLADFRCDQFSLGSVLYEMVTGRRVWKRNTPAESLVAIIREEPEPIAQAAPGTPQALAWIIERCLGKDPEERYASTRDLARDLRQVISHLSQTTSSSVAGAPGTGRLGRFGSLTPGLAALALGAALGAAGMLLQRRAPVLTQPVSRYLTYSGRESEPAASPDGKFVAFTSQRGGQRQIWLKQLADGSEIALTSGPDHAPRFTPDGAAILFSRLENGMQSTYRVPTVGGAARRLIADAGTAEPAPDGKEIAFLRPATRSGFAGFDLVVAAAEGGSERTLHHLVGLIACPPRWSPDGRTIAVPYSLTGTIGGNPYHIALVSREKGKIQEIVPQGAHGTLSSAVFIGGGRELLYIELDPGYFSTSGRIVRQDISSGQAVDVYRGLSLGTQLDVIGDGRIVYEASTIRANLRELPIGPGETKGWEQGRWLSRGNSVDRQPFYSPDGERVVFTSNRENNMDIWELTLSNGTTRRLTDNPADDWDPFLSRDGKYLLWSSKRSGNYEIWLANPDGTQPRQLSRDGMDAENPTVAPDGQGGTWVYYGSYGAEKPGIFRVRLDGSGTERILSSGAIRDPAASPDGKHVAFTDVSEPNHARLRIARTADGSFESFVLDTQVNPAAGVGGFRIRFTPDGRAVVYGGLDAGGVSALWIQAFDPDHDTTASRRRIAVFDEAQAVETLTVSPDGRRVIVSEAERPSDLVFVDGLSGVAK